MLKAVKMACGTESMFSKVMSMIFIKNSFGSQSKFVSMFFKLQPRQLAPFSELIKQSEIQRVNNNKHKPLEDLMDHSHPQAWEEVLEEEEVKFQASRQ